MTDYIKAGKYVTDSYDLSSNFSLSGTTLSITGLAIVPATNTDGYIPQWDGADSGTLKNGVELSTDGTLGGNSDTAVPTEQAVKTYAAPITTTPLILDSAVASTTVGNTANETTLYTISIPANTLGTANALRLTIIGTWLQNAAKSVAIKLKYGGTTAATTAAAAIDDSATTTGLKIDALLMAQGATNSQFGAIFLNAGVRFANSNPISSQGTAAEDSTGALNLVVSAQWSGAHASATLTSKYVILEKIMGV